MPLSEGFTVAAVRGTVVAIRLENQYRRHRSSGSHRGMATISVRPDGNNPEEDPPDELTYEVEAGRIAQLCVGQRVGIEINIIAARE